MSGCCGVPGNVGFPWWPAVGVVPVPFYPGNACCNTPAPAVPCAPACCTPPICGSQVTMFCPTADVPAPIALTEGGGATQAQVQLYGTSPFSAAKTLNPMLPSGSQLLQTLTIQGNVLTINTAAPILGDAGSYDAVITVSNGCGTWAIPVHVDITP